MSYSVPPTVVTGDIIPASYGNLLKANLDYHQGLLDGTGSDQVTFPAATRFKDNLAGNLLFGYDTGSSVSRVQTITRALYWCYNLSYNGTDWNRDDTTKVGWQTHFGGSGVGFDAVTIQRAPAGSNPATGALVTILNIDTDGKLTGAGFYSSGEVSLTSGNSANFAHGLGARPRAVWGFSSTSSGTEDSKTAPVVVEVSGTSCYAQTVDATNINVANISGATRYIHMYAML